MRYQAKEMAVKGKVKAALTVPDIEKILGSTKYSNEIYKTVNMPGVAVGLAWTYVGGDILFIELYWGRGKRNLN
jgi:ATP-dependent Lon protease